MIPNISRFYAEKCVSKSDSHLPKAVKICVLGLSILFQLNLSAFAETDSLLAARSPLRLAAMIVVPTILWILIWLIDFRLKRVKIRQIGNWVQTGILFLLAVGTLPQVAKSVMGDAENRIWFILIGIFEIALLLWMTYVTQRKRQEIQMQLNYTKLHALILELHAAGTPTGEIYVIVNTFENEFIGGIDVSMEEINEILAQYSKP